MPVGVAGQQEEPLITVKIAQRPERREMVVQIVGRLACVFQRRRAPGQEFADERRRAGCTGSRFKKVERLQPLRSVAHRGDHDAVATAGRGGRFRIGCRGQDLLADDSQQRIL